ncbi:STAS domain-containing protein [Streptomyces zhihengii]|uniref:STAS domain-containing protein n=1 Tax=Streptomyces zhihengii TaxID=1818004 RepID=UPI00363E7228
MSDTESTNPHPPVTANRLRVEVAPAGGVLVIAPHGEIDFQSVAPLEHALTAQDPAAHLVVDMRGVTFMDSSGINVLLAAYQTLTKKGGRLSLAAPTSSVLHTLRIVGVDTLLDCHPSLDSALNS